MYPDKFAPRADPDATLINKENWPGMRTPDFTKRTPKAIDDILRATQELTGAPPTSQISAPYSLAAASDQSKLIAPTDAKVSVNPLFIMRLESDKVDI